MAWRIFFNHQSAWEALSMVFLRFWHCCIADVSHKSTLLNFNSEKGPLLMTLHYTIKPVPISLSAIHLHGQIRSGTSATQVCVVSQLLYNGLWSFFDLPLDTKTSPKCLGMRMAGPLSVYYYHQSLSWSEIVEGGCKIFAITLIID